MILNFKTKFPGGEYTYFQGAITNGIKIHSIRKGSRWKPGNKIHFSTGARTKHYKCFKTGLCQSVQKIEITWNEPEDMLKIMVDEKEVSSTTVMRMAYYDGFSHMGKFEEWFKPLLPFTGQIIHWTDFKY